MRQPIIRPCNPELEFLRMPREERPVLARFLEKILARPATTAVDDARECVRHYTDEIREYIEDTGEAPASLDRYTCGADYQHEARINPELFRVAIERINSIAARGFRGPELAEAIELIIKNL